MSKYLTFVFGYDSEVDYVQWAPGNVLISGMTGSGLSVMLHNMLDSLVLRYVPQELHISAYDGKSLDLIPNNEGKGLSEVPHCYYVANNSILSFRSLIRYLTLRTERPMSYKEVFFLDNTEWYFDSLNELEQTAFIDALWRGPRVGVYFILTGHGDSYFTTLERAIDINVVLRASTDKLLDFLDTYGFSKDALPLYGKAVVADKRTNYHKLLTVPFYNRKAKLEIVKKEILPHGQLFDDIALSNFAVLNQLV